MRFVALARRNLIWPNRIPGLLASAPRMARTLLCVSSAKAGSMGSTSRDTEFTVSFAALIETSTLSAKANISDSGSLLDFAKTSTSSSTSLTTASTVDTTPRAFLTRSFASTFTCSRSCSLARSSTSAMTPFASSTVDPACAAHSSTLAASCAHFCLVSLGSDGSFITAALLAMQSAESLKNVSNSASASMMSGRTTPTSSEANHVPSSSRNAAALSALACASMALIKLVNSSIAALGLSASKPSFSLFSWICATRLRANPRPFSHSSSTFSWRLPRFSASCSNTLSNASFKSSNVSGVASRTFWISRLTVFAAFVSLARCSGVAIRPGSKG
mmetsp:Transcript_90164/g.254295  ORF Transcript_90164/g.254295 Transcript_90164/m.254295 type:complete len:332 (+) Transcript_90164:1415-2410(+)